MAEISMTILSIRHTDNLFWIKRWTVGWADQLTESIHCTLLAESVKGVGVQIARLKLSSWQWLTDSDE